jgi:hypothetical protein
VQRMVDSGVTVISGEATLCRVGWDVVGVCEELRLGLGVLVAMRTTEDPPSTGVPSLSNS